MDGHEEVIRATEQSATPDTQLQRDIKNQDAISRLRNPNPYGISGAKNKKQLGSVLKTPFVPCSSPPFLDQSPKFTSAANPQLESMQQAKKKKREDQKKISGRNVAHHLYFFHVM